MKEYAIIFIVLFVGAIIATSLHMSVSWSFYFGAIVGATTEGALREWKKP